MPDPQPEVTEYRELSCTCPVCESFSKSNFPVGVKAPVQYGSGVKALIVLLSVKCQLSRKNISKLCGDLFGYAVNSATIQSAIKKASEFAQPIERQIKD